MIIAIDGPAGSGKSSTARAVARQLRYLYLDTGAMYRAVGLAFLREHIPYEDSASQDVLRRIRLRVTSDESGQCVFLGEEDVSVSIREREVSVAASEVSRLPSVRTFLVSEQRRLARLELEGGRGVVMEGRDIGTVVFPEAALKIFLTADPGERARRRSREYADSGRAVDDGELLRELVERDERDETRAVSPLRPADDAVRLDTTGLTFEEQVERIVKMARERGA